MGGQEKGNSKGQGLMLEHPPQAHTTEQGKVAAFYYLREHTCPEAGNQAAWASPSSSSVHTDVPASVSTAVRPSYPSQTVV